MTLLFIFLVLHFIIMLKILPYQMVWGGRLKSDQENNNVDNAKHQGALNIQGLSPGNSCV